MADVTTTPNGNGKSNSTGNVPVADIDFGKVATDVAAKWTITPSISLAWTTALEFSTQASGYNTELSKRMAMGGNRPQITQGLKQLDNTIDDTLAYVKGYIVDKFKKEAAPSVYAAFGILHQKDKYVFPKDRNKRSAALELMISGIATNGFGDKEFGTAFWTDLKTQYDNLLGQATSTDGNISSRVSTKNTLKSSLKKTMNSLILAIKSNHPDSYKAELRVWGFQKEKY
jgi:hypothetical protein